MATEQLERMPLWGRRAADLSPGRAIAVRVVSVGLDVLIFAYLLWTTYVAFVGGNWPLTNMKLSDGNPAMGWLLLGVGIWLILLLFHLTIGALIAGGLGAILRLTSGSQSAVPTQAQPLPVWQPFAGWQQNAGYPPPPPAWAGGPVHPAVAQPGPGYAPHLAWPPPPPPPPPPAMHSAPAGHYPPPPRQAGPMPPAQAPVAPAVPGQSDGAERSAATS